MKKFCSRCVQEKESTEFCKRTAAKDGLQSACKSCMNVSWNASRTKKYDHYRNVQRIRVDKNYQEFVLWRSQQCCKVCFESDDSCLDLHHLDPSKKDGNISQFCRNRPFKSILQEINKCVVLCSNCHRKFHAGKINLGIA